MPEVVPSDGATIRLPPPSLCQSASSYMGSILKLPGFQCCTLERRAICKVRQKCCFKLLHLGNEILGVIYACQVSISMMCCKIAPAKDRGSDSALLQVSRSFVDEF